jgi:mono/diheme cytochrome c family protein
MKILKWGLYVITGVVLAGVIGLSVIYFVTEFHRNTEYEIPVESLSIPVNDDEGLLNGKHVATIRGCVDCHGDGFEGGIFIEDPVVGLLVATNLTSGNGGIGGEYDNEDWIRAIRHGVRKDKKSVVFMPSHEYNQIDRKDLADLIAYIKSVPPIDNELPETSIGLPFRAMYLIGGEIHLFPARLIDHSLPIPETVENRPPVELGEYLAATCTGCHGAGFSGGTIPGVPPNWPAATNLTKGGPLANYSVNDFVATMRTGKTPDGRELDSQFMPWVVFGQMTDEELSGLYTYLQSLPERETGSR